MPIQVELTRILIREMCDMQVVELTEVGGLRSFPIVIGLPEAYAIERRLKGEPVARPQSHDLMRDIITALSGTIERVDIIDLAEGTFFGRLTLTTVSGPVSIDCRPSDALALCAGSDLPIWVAESVLVKACDGAVDAEFPYITDDDEDE